MDHFTPRITTGPRKVGGLTLRDGLDREAVRYHIYRCYGADGELLYIGRSCTPMQRLRTHHARTDVTWPSQVVMIEGHGPYTWDEAVRIERDEITRKRPLHNIEFVLRNTRRPVDLTRAS